MGEWKAPVLKVLAFIAGVGAIVGLSVRLIGFGSIVAVPLLVYGAGLGVHSSVCVAMLVMTFLGLAGTIEKLHTRTIDWRSAAMLATMGAFAAPAGAWFNKQLSPTIVLALFAITAVVISLAVLVGDDTTAEKSDESQERPRSAARFRSGATGAVIGLLSGLLGISGGFIAVPMLVRYQKLTINRAVATSWVIVTVVSATAMLGHFLLGQKVPALITIFFAIGAAVAFGLAAPLSRQLSPMHLKRIYAGAVLAISILMLAKVIGS